MYRGSRPTIIYLIEWSNVVRVGAIDCTTLVNKRICSRYNVRGYPTIKVHVYGEDVYVIGRCHSHSQNDHYILIYLMVKLNICGVYTFRQS